MLRKCYGCEKELTVFGAMKGQAVFNWIDKLAKSDPTRVFEGWVHCAGEDSQFVQKEDTELEELCEQMDVDLCEGSPHACNKCARELASMEGIEVPRSVISGEDYIYRCPECGSLHVSIYHSTHTRFEYQNGVRVKKETVEVNSAYLIQCDKCGHQVDYLSNQTNDDFHDYETEIA